MLKTALRHTVWVGKLARDSTRTPLPDQQGGSRSPRVRTPTAGTHLVALLHVHVAVGIVVHLLVDVADGLEAELLVLVVAQGLVDAAELCWERTAREGQHGAAHNPGLPVSPVSPQLHRPLATLAPRPTRTSAG